MKIKIMLEPGAKMPKRSTKGAAAWDVFAHIHEPKTVHPGERIILPTGIKAQIPEGYFWDARARSGISMNHGLMLLNGAGVIDEDYRGISAFGYHNSSKEPYTFQPGEKIGQVILQKYEEQEFELVDELDSTDRGEGGFGHTGRI